MLTIPTITKEVFPEFNLDLITVSVRYLGAAPEEVEEGVTVRVEEAIQDIEGIKRITSTAAEGVGAVVVELEEGTNTRENTQRCQSACRCDRHLSRRDREAGDLRGHQPPPGDRHRGVRKRR